MERARFVQILAGATDGDASTEEARALALFAGGSGRFTSVETYAYHRAPALAFRVRHIRAFVPQPGDRILIHYGTHLPDLERLLLGRRYSMLFHNITPAHFFRPYSLRMTAELILARRLLGRLAASAQVVIAHSEFSARELALVCARTVRVVPYAPHNNALVARGGREGEARALLPAPPLTGATAGPRLLFVGRMAPNKGHAQLIKMLFFLRHWFPEARLILAGRIVRGAEAYAEELNRLTGALGLSSHVIPTGDLDADRLIAEYQHADVFVCASAHEGFCVPILEAMAFGLPVVAQVASTSAIIETMGGAGIAISPGSPPALAALVKRVLTDAALRSGIVSAQAARVRQFLSGEHAALILNLLEQGGD